MKIPLKHATFSLDVSGIAGFFGGEESLAAMASVHLVRGRKWVGWYNSPGSLYVAKKYGTLARSRIWDGLFPGANVDPSVLLELDGKNGPRYMGVYSGTRLATTGHLAYLLADHCENLKPKETSSAEGLPVVVINLGNDAKIQPNTDLPSNYFNDLSPFAIVPIAVSIATAVLCGIYEDWYSFAMIVLGIFCNGVSCLVLGSASLQVKFTIPSPNSPPGDGLLISSPGKPLIILRGNEHIVSCIVRGRYNLYYKSEDRYHDIGYSSLALTVQFLAQLFLIPQGELFGQIMFLGSLGVSWAFNSYLASVDREQLQMNMLLKILNNPTSEKILLPKYTAVVAFAAFSLKSSNTRAVLNELIPNETPTWQIWKARVVEAVETDMDPSTSKRLMEREAELSEQDQKLLWDLLDQASKGYIEANASK
ncbi:hypothetical protein BDZ97DRAFT_1657822 [Flammula alnicola]|nr:hypothetical protein BDZ97DRAFT_1657822 [Flammula alnicola]